MKYKGIAIIAVVFILIIAIFEGWFKLSLDDLRNSRLLGYVATKQYLLPESLRGSFDAFTSNLTITGVLEYTNIERQKEGKSVLKLNPKLNIAAEAKMRDMFDKQYFEHVSPTGVTPSDVIKNAQYAYLVVGENLALGNFKDDQALVAAWMNSPGHRENIMNGKYQEIGIAVGKGQYEGKEVWMAVQEFGTPLSSCPSPSGALKEELETNKSRLDYLQQALQKQKQNIESTKYDSTNSYNLAVEKYNQSVAQFNELSKRNKTVIEQYNLEVNTFNDCLEKNG